MTRSTGDRGRAGYDLHTHSNASDGTDAPAALPQLARAAGLQGFALTDHDTTAGLAAAADAASRAGMTFVPGIELSVDPDVFADGTVGGTLHLLGHFVDPASPALRAVTQRMRAARADRNPQIIERLKASGVRVSLAEVNDAAGPGATVGRPHIAQVLVQKGYVKSMHEAFSRYLGPGAAAHVRRDRLTAEAAIAALRAAGGTATLAHPVQLRLSDDAGPAGAHDAADPLTPLLRRLQSFGLDAVEVRHSDHAPADADRFARLAGRLNLLTTGGSDYHGGRKTIALGAETTPAVDVERLRAVAARRSAVGAAAASAGAADAGA